jgi:EAL domain-containing protein (putative c-di-GMP-specific phosphodiesterase class I)
MQDDETRGVSGERGLAERLEFAYQVAERQHTLLAVMALAYRSRKLDIWPEGRRRAYESGLRNRLQQFLRTMDYVGEPLAEPQNWIPVVATLQELGELEPIISRLRSALIASDDELDDLQVGIGVAVYPFDNGSPKQLLELASNVATESLGAARQRFHYANAELEAWRVTSSDLHESIIHGLGRGEFEVLYQPVIEAATGLPVALEALLHWRHPERGVLTPGNFLPFAQRYTWLMRELGEWVLAEVAEALPAFDVPFPAPLKISLNLGLAEILTGDFTTHLRRQLESHPGLDARRLVFELPREALDAEDTRVSAVIEAGREIGVGWALDAGFESLALNTLVQLPLEWVKFDTRALHDPGNAVRKDAAFRALGQLMCALGSRPVFTHVEDEGLRRLLADDSEMLLQGYGIAAPMQPSVLQNWLRSRR